jgi:hypothetical protein
LLICEKTIAREAIIPGINILKFLSNFVPLTIATESEPLSFELFAVFL